MSTRPFRGCSGDAGGGGGRLRRGHHRLLLRRGLARAARSLTMPVVGMAEAAAVCDHAGLPLLDHRRPAQVDPQDDRQRRPPRLGTATCLVSVGGDGHPGRAADPGLFFDRVIEEGRRAVTEDGAEVMVLSEIATPAFWDRAQKRSPSRSSTPGSPAGSGPKSWPISTRRPGRATRRCTGTKHPRSCGRRDQRGDLAATSLRVLRPPNPRRPLRRRRRRLGHRPG